MRLATYHSDAARQGPGLLLHALLQGKDPQLNALAQVIAVLDADILLLHDIDLDAGGATSAALGRFLAQNGAPYPHILAPMPNAGVPSGLDLNGDGRLGRANDALGFGAFRGQGGMVLLSRLPIITEDLIDFTGLLWRELPGANLPTHSDGTPFPSAAALDVQPLSAVGAWAVPLRLPGGAGRRAVAHPTKPRGRHFRQGQPPPARVAGYCHTAPTPGHAPAPSCAKVIAVS